MTQQYISNRCLLEGDRNYIFRPLLAIYWPNARWWDLNIDTRPHALRNHSSITHFFFGWETWRWPI